MNTGINSDYGTRLMNAIADGTSISFPVPYVGLLDANGAEISYPEYCRVAINAIGIEGKNIMAEPAVETITETESTTAGNTYSETKVKTSVQNQDYIYFPENETGSAVTVAALGIFTAKTGGSAYLTGWLKNDNNEKITVTINPNSVPMFRIGKFKISVK